MASLNKPYTIYKLGIPLYYDSGSAAKRNYTPHSLTFTGETIIDNIAWTDANGNWYYPNQGAGTIPIYSIRDKTKSYGIGWIRSDDNYSPSYVSKVYNANTESNWKFELTRTAVPSTAEIAIYVNNTYIKQVETSSESITVTLTESERNKVYSALANATEGVLEMRTTTLVNGQTLGTDTRTIKLTVPESVQPKFIVEPKVIKKGEKEGKLYKGMSSISVAFTGEASKGAKLTGQQIKIGNQSFSTNSVKDVVLNQAGTIPIVATITDSRGKSAMWSDVITVEDYSRPAVELFEVRRDPSNQTKVLIEAFGSYDAISDKLPQYVIQYKKKSDKTWISQAPSNTVLMQKSKWKIDSSVSNIDSSSTYDFKLSVIDSKGYVIVATQSLGTEALPLELGKHGIAVGKSFDNSSSIDLQVGKGGIDSEGPIKIGGIPINSGPSAADIQSMVNNGLKGLIEYGSSSDGHWIRLFDGIQICWISGLERTPKWMDDYKASGGLWRTDSLWWKLPKPFKDNNFFAQISSDEMIGTGQSWTVWYTTFKSSNVDRVGYNGWSFTFQSNIKLQKLKVRGFAIGRWK
ncbi:DUF859 family phage minor structural protein [Facklamia hominis]|uniref:DUF859 family phage minor structural protein n=1 Tax=Facklamia hominis TaxID=178214 RepID=UPI000353628E|nr:DUF859 family phage minor structural protein [Facklamia hominis]EPH12531.1 hypothetical protein HMPREF9260_00646 [Facklamia hominis ACS-120-V-Sch10]PKY92978.1 hypothetical protein CYJ56_04870 [Facklamia hominis]